MSKFSFFWNQHFQGFRNLFGADFAIAVSRFDPEQSIASNLHVLPAHFVGRSHAEQRSDELHLDDFFEIFYTPKMEFKKIRSIERLI